MFGIQLVEIFQFLSLAGIAVAGATALWGSIFLLLSRKASERRESALWQGAAQKLLWVFFPSLFFYGIMWGILAIKQCIFCIQAHEGISLAQDINGLTLGMQNQYPFFFILMFVGFALFLPLWFFRGRRFSLGNLSWGYGLFFIMISIMLLYPWGGFESIRYSVSSGLHNWHAILTIGSVIVIDFLYIVLRFSLRPLVARIFPMITMGIWIGLGLDFVSSGLIFNEEFFLTDKFLFTQTLIGIVIINGVLLSGPIARAILAFQARMKSAVVSPQLHRIIGISGAFSLAAWLSNGALDGFKTLTLSYWQLALFYVLFAGIIFLSRDAAEKLLKRYAGR